jgi:hypothetical protein
MEFVNGLLSGNGAGQYGQVAAYLPMLYGANRAADEHNEQAGRYETLGREAAAQADPWGNDRRRYYQGRQDELLADPTQNPVYQSMMRVAGERMGPQAAAGGLHSSLASAPDFMRMTGDISNQFLGQWADRYAKWGGSEVDPSNAARMLMEGGKQAGDARNAALAARMMGLGGLSDILAGCGQNGGGNPNGGGTPNPNGAPRPSGSPTGGAPTGRIPGTNISVPSGIQTAQQLMAYLNSLPPSSIPPNLFSILQGENIGDNAYGVLPPNVLETIYGPGYGDFVTQNPLFPETPWDQGNFGELPTIPEPTFGGRTESLFGPGGGFNPDPDGYGDFPVPDYNGGFVFDDWFPTGGE